MRDVFATRRALKRASLMFNVTQSDILSSSRRKIFVLARTYVMASLSGQGFGLSHIGRKLDRDHTTVLHALKKAA